MSYFKSTILFLILTISYPLIGQEKELVSVIKIDKDSIAIKWLPNNYSQLLNIAEGAKVSRVESNSDLNLDKLDYSNAKTWNIPSTKENLKSIKLSNEDSERINILLEPVLTPVDDEKQSNFSFGLALFENITSPTFQYILGNILVDKEYEKSKKYAYKIEVKNEKPIYVFIDPTKKTTYSEISDLNLSLDKKKVVNVEWNSKNYSKEAFGFLVEHSIDKIKEGTYLTEKPYLPFKSNFEKEDKKDSYRDSPEPGHNHYYRLHGIDLFGYASLVSEWKKIYVPYLINAEVVIDTIFASKEERIIKTSTFEKAKKAKINTIELYRSTDQKGKYDLIESRSYIDSNNTFNIKEPHTGDSYYYKAMLVNDDDTVSSLPHYFFTLDQEPPKSPGNLTGKIDENGIATINWSEPEDKDVKGYKIYRGNALHEEFIEQNTRIIETKYFTDTLALNNLTSEVYYYVKSIDQNYNQSLPSDTLLLLKPDSIPPIAAIIKKVSIKDSVLEIKWINSNSLDIANNYLIRYSNNLPDTVFQWKSDTSVFVDKNVNGGQYYQYEIRTLDKSNNASKSDKFTQFFEPGYRKPIGNFRGIADMDKKAVFLSWDIPKDDIYSFKIYRGKPEQKLLPLKTINDKGVNTFSDKTVKINNKYIYTIKYINKDGIHSMPAKVEVIYQ